MKTLNLVDIDKSDIKYQIQKFPDGQQNIVIDDSEGIHKTIDKQKVGLFYSIQIKSRLNNWLDLELITCAVASLREIDRDIEIHLYTPYIMGARSDRKFEKGGNNYIKDVIAPVINLLNFKTVTCIDPHSDVLEACIKGFRKESNLELVNFTLEDVCEIYHDNTLNLDDFILVSPDAGASKKIYKLAEQIGYKGDIITCSKDRDVEGKLTRTIVPLPNYTTVGKDIIIIDDICDGGATFINIAKSLKEQEIRGKIYLIVTHSIFSKGFDELSKYFDGIYTTNSYKDIDCGFDTLKNPNQDFIEQLNVF